MRHILPIKISTIGINIKWPKAIYKTLHYYKKYCNIFNQKNIEHSRSFSNPTTFSIHIKQGITINNTGFKKPVFLQAKYGFLAFNARFYAIANLQSKETIIASEDTPSSCEQAFIRATKICVVPYTAHIPSILMQFDNIIWHSTSPITQCGKSIGQTTNFDQPTYSTIASKVHQNMLDISNMHTKSANFGNTCDLIETLPMNSNGLS